MNDFRSTPRRLSVSASALLGLLASASAARAADGPEETAVASAAVSSQAGALLPMTISPGVAAGRAAVTVNSGYDGGRASATLATAADVHVWGPAALRVGFVYMPDGGDQKLQPNVGVRLQVLRQESHGVDGGIGVYYRMERFTQDEGLLQVMAAFGRRFDRLGLFANLAYGQDPEGDDRDGDLKLAALYTTRSWLQLGVDGRARIDLFSDDARRASRGETNFDFAAGPLACVTMGRFALLGQVGMSGVRGARWQTGVLATMGAASVF